MSRALGVDVAGGPDAWPTASPGLGPADELRAQALSAALRAHLRERARRALVRRARAPGACCASCGWRAGRSTPRRSRASSGAPGLDPGPLAAEAGAAASGP